MVPHPENQESQLEGPPQAGVATATLCHQFGCSFAAERNLAEALVAAVATAAALPAFAAVTGARRCRVSGFFAGFTGCWSLL